LYPQPPTNTHSPTLNSEEALKRSDVADRMIPGNWQGDPIIGKDGAGACATLVERTTRYLIIVALPLGRRADQVCDALTRRIQGLSEGAMRTLTWDQGPEMARHQRLTPGAGVEVFVAHPTAPGREEPTTIPTDSSAATCPTEPHHQSPTLPRRHRRRAGQLSQSNPRLPHPTEAFNQLIATTH
ncbi:IS30 family transposase, partial [uncultured Actinomyces sp.]|uniref:IS30 family transposase n=1 Tax=uncultured Actinomyces sp. TaxID=249061 RepID=UPI0028D61838